MKNNNIKWFLSLYSHDHGFQSADPEGIIYDDLQSILRNNSGAKYIMSELRKWRNSYYRNDEEYKKLNDLIKYVDYDVALKDIVDRAHKDPNEEQQYYLDNICGTECSIQLRIADEDDVDWFPNAKDLTIKETALMKKKYTKKQITEAIAYWKKQLNEGTYHYAYTVEPYLYVTQLNSCFAKPVRKIGSSHGSKVERENPETLEKKLRRYSACVAEDWKAAYQIILDDEDANILFTCEKELFDLLASSRKGNKELFDADDNKVKAAVDEFMLRHPTAELVTYIG